MTKQCPICKGRIKTIRLFFDLEKEREKVFDIKTAKPLGMGERAERCLQCLSTFSQSKRQTLIVKGEKVSQPDWKRYKESITN